MKGKTGQETHARYRKSVKNMSNPELGFNAVSPWFRSKKLLESQFDENAKDNFNYKVNISLHPDDLELAAKVLMENGLFSEELCQKIAIKGEKEQHAALAIILYHVDSIPQDWQKRLQAIEEVLYDAGVRPRAISPETSKAVDVNDKKIPGSLYCYYKKDHDSKWAPNYTAAGGWEDGTWNKEDERRKNPFANVAINLERKIQQRIEQLEGEVKSEHLAAERKREKEAHEFYLKMSQMSGADAQRIQHNAQGLRDSLEIANEVIGQSQLKAKTTIESRDILGTRNQAIVNAGNQVLDLGYYGISGLSRAIHDAACSSEEYRMTPLPESGKFFYEKRVSPFIDKLVSENSQVTEDCDISVELWTSGKDGKFVAALEESQAKSAAGKLLWVNPKEKKFSEEKQAGYIPYYQQKTAKIKAKKLKAREVAAIDLRQVDFLPARSPIKDKIIIHTAGPDCRRDEFNPATSTKFHRKKTLKNAYVDALDKAYDMGVRRIALPILSVGAFQFPEDEAAEVLVEVLREQSYRFENIEVLAHDPKKPGIESPIIAKIKKKLYRPIKKLEKLPSLSPAPEAQTILRDKLKSWISVAVAPRRYQVLIGMLKHYCGVEIPAELSSYVDNSKKFRMPFDPSFDSDKEPQTEAAKKFQELSKFNRSALSFLNENNGEMWNRIIAFAAEEAMCKDLLRIKEKFKLADGDARIPRIQKALKVIYSESSDDGQLLESFNELKKILIAARLVKNGIDAVKAVQLAERFIARGEKLASIITELSPNLDAAKIEKIFTKFVTLGKIDDLAQLRFRIEEKKIIQLQSRITDETFLLDKVRRVEMHGDETLFRGVRLGKQGDKTLTIDEQRELIKRDFFGSHIAVSYNEKQQQARVGFAQIFRERHMMTNGLASRGVVATSFDFNIAASYALVKGSTVQAKKKPAEPPSPVNSVGWVYEMKPKANKRGTIIATTQYKEIDFDQVEPQDIFAVHRVEFVDGTLRIAETIPNPNYKKRPSDKSDQPDFFAGISPTLRSKEGVKVEDQGKELLMFKDDDKKRRLFLDYHQNTERAFKLCGDRAEIPDINDKPHLEAIVKSRVDLPETYASQWEQIISQQRSKEEQEALRRSEELAVQQEQLRLAELNEQRAMQEELRLKDAAARAEQLLLQEDAQKRRIEEEEKRAQDIAQAVIKAQQEEARVRAQQLRAAELQAAEHRQKEEARRAQELALQKQRVELAQQREELRVAEEGRRQRQIAMDKAREQEVDIQRAAAERAQIAAAIEFQRQQDYERQRIDAQQTRAPSVSPFSTSSAPITSPIHFTDIAPSVLPSTSVLIEPLKGKLRGNKVRIMDGIYEDDNPERKKILILNTLFSVIHQAIEQVNQSLDIAEGESLIDKDEMQKIIIHVLKYGGISHHVVDEGENKTHSEKLYGVPPAWKRFSKLVQDSNADVGIFTGREKADSNRGLNRNTNGGLRTGNALDLLLNDANPAQMAADLTNPIHSDRAAAKVDHYQRKVANKIEKAAPVRDF